MGTKVFGNQIQSNPIRLLNVGLHLLILHKKCILLVLPVKLLEYTTLESYDDIDILIFANKVTRSLFTWIKIQVRFKLVLPDP